MHINLVNADFNLKTINYHIMIGKNMEHEILNQLVIINKSLGYIFWAIIIAILIK